MPALLSITGAKPLPVRRFPDNLVLKVLWCVIFTVFIAPLLLLWLALAIPVSVVRGVPGIIRRRRFLAEMRAKGRVISGEQAETELHAERGTFISESGRLWWTPEYVPDVSPHACRFEDVKHAEPGMFDEWCRARYTDAESGSAFLIDENREMQRFFEYLYSARSNARFVHVISRA